MEKTIAQELGVEISDDQKWVTLAGDYDIELARIKTERDLLAWVLQITEKSWVTVPMVRAFIGVVKEAKGFKLFGL